VRQARLLRARAARLKLATPAALLVRRSLLERELEREPDSDLQTVLNTVFKP
jgi:hypothetical protein